MRFGSKIGLFAACFVLLLGACKKNKCEDNVPTIEFKEFEQYNKDSLKITIGFKDCDGDVGLSQSDTVAPYVDENYFNLFIDYFEMQHGAWVQVVPEFFDFNYRVPYIDQQSRSKVLEGDIQVTLEFYYSPLSNADSVKYHIVLKDRALQESNVVITPVLTIP